MAEKWINSNTSDPGLKMSPITAGPSCSFFQTEKIVPVETLQSILEEPYNNNNNNYYYNRNHLKDRMQRKKHLKITIIVIIIVIIRL